MNVAPKSSNLLTSLLVLVLSFHVPVVNNPWKNTQRCMVYTPLLI